MKKFINVLFAIIFISTVCLLSGGCVTKIETGYLMDNIFLSTNSSSLLYLKYLKIGIVESDSNGSSKNKTMFNYEERYLGKNIYKLCGAQNNKYWTSFSYDGSKDLFNKIKINDDNSICFYIVVYAENSSGNVYKNTTFNASKNYKIENKKVKFYNYGGYEESCNFTVPLASTLNISIEFNIKQTEILINN